MRIQIMSDIHFEFHRDNGNLFFKNVIEKRKSLGIDAPDVLVLAGDIVTLHRAKEYLKKFSDLFPQIIFVAGNHEYYGSEIKAAQDTYASLGLSNLHWLERKTIELCGKRFLGATLWFCESDVKRSGANENWLSDFSEIKGSDTRGWIYSEHEKSERWLHENTQVGDIVITHHLPAYQVISPRWRGSKYNSFFASNQLDTIHQKKPSLWLCGHTHDSIDQVIASTRCVVNPYGYAPSDTNPNFDFSLILSA